MSSNRTIGAIALGLFVMVGCASAPETRNQQEGVTASADATLNAMVKRNPGLRNTLDEAVGYVVFPRVTEGGMILGAGGGLGVVYANGRPIGYARLRRVAFGALAGSQRYSELIVLHTPAALRRVRSDDLDVDASASATAVTEGSGAMANAQTGTTVYMADERGFMASAAIGTQQIDFVPLEANLG